MEVDGQATTAHSMMERIRVVTPEGGAIEVLRTYNQTQSQQPDHEQEEQDDPR